MSDSLMVERWNVIDSADMAVSIEGVLHRVIQNKKMPYDYEESLGSAIEFLDEAGNGGAIICGTVTSSGFTGTLAPLSWSTDVYIGVKPQGEAEEGELYQKVVETLNEYKMLLEKMRGNKTIDTDSPILKRAHEFFGRLGNLLLSEADPLTRSYSQPVGR